MILNIRGTHGSGKSTVVKGILDKYPTEELEKTPRGKPETYKVAIPWLRKPLYVIGPYVTACGGCDAIQPYSRILPLVEKYAKLGHVIFEGVLISTNYGTIGEASEAYGNDFVFLVMDTPVEVCLERVTQRRLARGNTKPLNPAQTVLKHKNINSCANKIREEKGRRVETLDHKHPLPKLLGLLREGDASE